MSKKPPAIPLFGDAYLADTTHLTTEEHGAYLLLIMASWRQENCDLPLDDRKLARIVGMTTRKWASIKPTIMEFWTVENGRMFQARLRKERAFVRQKSEANRQNADARWAKQVNENKPNGGMRPQCETDAPSPSPSPSQERVEPKGSCASGDAPLTVAELVEDWNGLAEQLGLSKVAKLTDSRKRRAQARLRQYPELGAWQQAFATIRATPFLLGDNKTGWRADFDFLLQDKSFTKLVEGSYGQA